MTSVIFWQMWISVSTIAIFCVIFNIGEGARAKNDWEVMFGARSDSDWKNVWHQEKHTRCRESLVGHLYWACEKDIYRLTRRSDPNRSNTVVNTDENDDYPWIGRQEAKKMLRVRRRINRRSGSSITSECCKSSGCTWEEYAEYCPTNKRYTSYV